MVTFLVLGIIFGVIINYFSIGFCGAAYYTIKGENSYSFRMLLLSVLIGGIGIFAIKTYVGQGFNYIGVMGIDLSLAVGAFIFGIGMMLSDGCILGMIRDLGNGYIGHIITVAFVIIGTLLGNLSYKSLWMRFKMNAIYVYLPESFGLVAGAIIFLIIVAFVYFEFYLWDRKNLGKDSHLPKKSIVGGIVLGIFLIVYQAIVENNIGVSGAFPYFGAWISKLFGGHPENWSFFQIESAQEIIKEGFFSYEIAVLILGILIGSLVTAIATRKFELHKPNSIKDVSLYAVGGLLMGYGSCVAGSCNLSGFLSSAANLSLSAWMYLFFMMLGSFVIIKVLKW